MTEKELWENVIELLENGGCCTICGGVEKTKDVPDVVKYGSLIKIIHLLHFASRNRYQSTKPAVYLFFGERSTEGRIRICEMLRDGEPITYEKYLQICGELELS